MKIGIATDHNGVNEKKVIIEELNKLNIEVVDYSPNNNATDDYPDYAVLVANAVKESEVNLGVLMCGTGIGMSIAANKVDTIRCAKVSNIDEARLAKEHNNANIIALSYKENIEDLINMITTFINTPFSNEERHARRVEKINNIRG